MANRKFLIDSILGLAQKLGANPNKFMGTKQNINFLGTGDRGMKGTTFSGQLNEDFLDLGFGKNDMIKIIEQDAGYVTAGKLNDSQLNTMFNNLKMIDETFNPLPGPANVVDLKTGTRNLNKEGLESLRTEQMSFTDKIGEGIKSIKTKLTGGADDVATKKVAEDDFTRMGAADFGDSVQAEGARRAVVRQVMKNNSNYFGLTPEMAESIAKSKDLARGGSNFPDPLIVFREKGNFTRQELEQIDAIIESNPFDDIKIIADKVSKYLQDIRPDGFADGGRIGYKIGGIAKLYEAAKKAYPLLKSEAKEELGKLFNILNKNTITVKRGESGTTGASGQGFTEYRGKYFNLPEGGFEGASADARFYSKLGGKRGKPKVLTAELTPEEIIEGKRLRGLDVNDPEIGDIILPESAKNKIRIDYLNTIRARIEKILGMAEGGRVGYRSGKSVKGIAELLKLTNKKFGKDTLKVADDVEPSEFAKFNERNRKLTDEEYDDLVEEYGEGVPFDIETVADAEKFVASQKAYEASMLADYKAGRLDPKPGEPNRKRFLEKKAEEAQGSGDRRLFTIDEAEELEALQQGEQYGSIKNAKIPIELITADILKAKYPGITDDLAELIGNDTNLQRKAEALASIEQAMALQGAGKSADETIAILKGEPETKMSKGGLARILEM